MFRKILPLFFLLLAGYLQTNGQCTTLGQTPATAFPVCGSSTFHQNVVPECSNGNVSASTCGSYPDMNPFWYKFTCYQTGTLGFVIDPVDQSDDYDWQIFDVTGHDPNDVFTDPSLFVSCNWSGNTGNTGASSAGTTLNNCAGTAYPLFSSMPTIYQGHQYILLLSHFTTFNPGDDGYDLSFTGGTAVITDSVTPSMLSAKSNCAGDIIYLKLNKKMQCKSLSVNGSDFKVSLPGVKVIAASGANCNNSFDMDSVVITLDKPLPPGDYTLIIQKGDDDNTLLDNCDNTITENSSVPFTVFPLAPTSMDSISPIQCQPGELRLVFKNRIRCNSIAADGSDFTLIGPAGVTISGAFADSCSNGLSSVIKVKLSKPITLAGNFTLMLKKGSDGNTILDECAQETPEGSSLSFVTKDVVSAAFFYSVKLGCTYDTLYYAHDGRNGVNKWNWIFDINGTSNLQSSFFLFNDYGKKHIQLTVTNGVCTDSASTDILLDNELKAQFTVGPSTELCPEDSVFFTDSSIGKITSWYWTFGDGTTNSTRQPLPKLYTPALSDEGKIYPIVLVIKNDIGCSSAMRQNIKVLYNCYIAVPSAFTPNRDGLNDYLYPLNAYKADNLEFKVYNRWGQLVYQTKDWTKKWDGTINGYIQPAGTYVWMLNYINRDTGKPFKLKGTTVLIR